MSTLHNELYGEKNPIYEDEHEWYIYIKTGPEGGVVVSDKPRTDLPFEPRFALHVEAFSSGCECCGSWGECDVEILKGKDITKEVK
jgi:hypothetical protein